MKARGGVVRRVDTTRPYRRKKGEAEEEDNEMEDEYDETREVGSPPREALSGSACACA